MNKEISPILMTFGLASITANTSPKLY